MSHSLVRRARIPAIAALVTASVALAGLQPAAAAPTDYTAQPLPLLRGYTTGSVSDLNDKGVAVGHLNDARGAQRPVLWKGGKVRALRMPPGASSAVPHALNNNGMVVGEATRRSTGDTTAVVWVKGVAKWLPVPPRDELMQDRDYTSARGVSDTGVIVGEVFSISYVSPIAWRGPRFTYSTAGGEGSGLDVNSSGVAVATNYQEQSEALRWDLGTGVLARLPQGPTAQGSQAYAINEASTIVGSQMFEIPDELGLAFQGTVWAADGTITEVPIIPTDLNDVGDLLGGTQAIVAGEVVDLPGIEYATAINDSRVVVGNTSTAPMILVPTG